MSVSISDAADQMADRFRAVADVEGWPVEWPNFAFTKPADSATWARWALAYTSGGQNTLGGVDGRPRFGKSGIIEVTLYTPLGVGLNLAYTASQAVIAAYEGQRTPGDVWFRDVRIVEERLGAGDYSAWWMTTIVVDFEHD